MEAYRIKRIVILLLALVNLFLLVLLLNFRWQGSRSRQALSQALEELYAQNEIRLPQELDASAQESGTSAPREAPLLSQGTADQLYLAVRLAICDLVLPPEKQAPLVLDDALASFDDARCAAALRYLKETAGERQILLFTCHSREADFFAGHGEVFVQRLTSAAGRV